MFFPDMLLIHCHRFGTNFVEKNLVKHLANTKQGFFQQNWSQNGDTVLATCLEKNIINYSSKKMEL